MAKKKVRIFYSWQSDSPSETNHNGIRNALRKAMRQLKPQYPDLTLILDEATRETSGSFNIATEIIEKLGRADIVIADITSVTSPRAKRPCPNPNVSYELGYAVGQVGWNRIILLFNTALAKFPGDLPFDFNQNRASPYALKEGASPTDREKLVGLAFVSIKAVLDLNPKRPSELKGVPREKIEHDHDVKKMKWLMESLHLPTIDELIENIPQRISNRSIWHWENFNGIVENSLFELYDPALKNLVARFHRAWLRALSHDEHYVDNKGSTASIFHHEHRQALRGDEKGAWADILDAREEMRFTLDAILERLRSAYHKVDISKSNRKAHRGYIEQYTDPPPKKGKGRDRKKK
ncbi:hypothetical protein CVO77_17215 [Sphingopyxis lindanitolerans]|uniref:CD-NTase-associated protein 12/Pycsar effector protein TIR domain-containing protein n=1 Tax=Sphingopyxis lindanitolerans TaxID=2054227 RepID=A0A2S8B2V1_9SPHN|nr:hypothetical protein [Sphingopyxis lindanitolerans]PQM26741.1 hypothetical protein CVO77_17215 [Sphingopyxis lindanitolerans]